MRASPNFHERETLILGKTVKLVISDAHDGLPHAMTHVLGAMWQRCRVHDKQRAATCAEGPAHHGRCAIRRPFYSPENRRAHQTWRREAGQLRSRWRKLAAGLTRASTTSWPTWFSRPNIASS